MSPDEIQPFMQATIRKWIRSSKCYVQAIPAEIQAVHRAKDGSAATRLIVRDERTGRNSTWVNYWHRIPPKRPMERRFIRYRRLLNHMRGPGFEDMDNQGEGAGGPYGYAYGPHTPVGIATDGVKGVLLCGPPPPPRGRIGVTVIPAATIEEAQAQVRAQQENREDNFGVHGGMRPSTVGALRKPDLWEAATQEDPERAILGRSKLGPIGETFVSAGYPAFVLDIGRKIQHPQARSDRDVLDPTRPTMRMLQQARSDWMAWWASTAYDGVDHLHVVLDDGNTDRATIAACLRDWRAAWCKRLQPDDPGLKLSMWLADCVDAASVRQLRGSRRLPPRPHGHQADQDVHHRADDL